MATQFRSLSAFSPALYRPKQGSYGSDAAALSEPVSYRLEFRPATEPGQPVAVTAEEVPPAWVRPLIASLARLLQLPENWNGYGAAAVREFLVAPTLRVLAEIMDEDAPAPSAVPLSDGGLQLEWHRHGKNLEIEFPPDGEPGFYYYEDSSETEEEGRVSGNYDHIQRLVASLK